MRSHFRLALLALLAAAGCADAPRAPRNVLLVTIDTLRADHLSCYGYARPTSPHLDALAAEGVRFERALVPIPRTTQSLASLLTGREPWRHGVRDLHHRLPAAETTVAERFAAAGFATGARVVVPFLADPQGLDQGFQDFRTGPLNADVRADELTDQALAWLERAGGRPFLLWLHYRDPHAPYYAHEDGPDFDPDYEGPYEHAFHYWPIDAQGRPLPGTTPRARQERKGRFKFGAERHDPRDVERIVALYDGEIAHVDRAIGRLLEGLDRLGRADDTVVVVTADHGESLGEHDFWFDHGEFLYDTCLRVPLIVRLPGGARGAVVREQVGLVDVAPTLLELFDLPPLEAASGASFAPALRGDRVAGRPLLAESGEPLMWERNPRFAGLDAAPPDPAQRLRALATPERAKGIWDPVAPEGEELQLFRVAQDPGEVRDRAGDPELAREARAAAKELAEFAARTAEAAGGEDRIGDAARAAMEQQGYVAGGGVAGTELKRRPRRSASGAK